MVFLRTLFSFRRIFKKTIVLEYFVCFLKINFLANLCSMIFVNKVRYQFLLHWWSVFFPFSFPQLQIDVVELDGAVAEVAKTWFGFIEDQRMRVYVEDGLNYIHKLEEGKPLYGPTIGINTYTLLLYCYCHISG